MEMQKISSTNIAAVGYDKETRKMRVHFKRGGRYVLHDIEPEIFDEFVQAESPGGFYAKRIRGLYHFERLEGEE